MKKFIFNDITIQEAHKQFFQDIGEKYQLQNGKTVKIDDVSPLQEIRFTRTNLQAFAESDFLPNGEVDLAAIIEEGPQHFGFKVKVSTPYDKKGYKESWWEWITIPIELSDKKCFVEKGYSESLIHNKS
jgi:hypothetical protein